MSELGDIEYKRGDTKPIRLTINGKETGEPVDLTGCSFIMTVDPSKTPEDNINNIMSISGTVDPDQVTNTGKVIFEPSITGTDHVGAYYYDIQMTDANGYIDTFITGKKFKLIQEITK